MLVLYVSHGSFLLSALTVGNLMQVVCIDEKSRLIKHETIAHSIITSFNCDSDYCT